MTFSVPSPSSRPLWISPVEGGKGVPNGTLVQKSTEHANREIWPRDFWQCTPKCTRKCARSIFHMSYFHMCCSCPLAWTTDSLACILVIKMITCKCFVSGNWFSETSNYNWFRIPSQISSRELWQLLWKTLWLQLHRSGIYIVFILVQLQTVFRSLLAGQSLNNCRWMCDPTWEDCNCRSQKREKNCQCLKDGPGLPKVTQNSAHV